MSTVTSAVTTCPALQDMLDNNFPVCPYNLDPIALLPFLYSEENRTAINFKVNPVPGKKRTLQAVYDQIISDSEVQTLSDCEGNCTASTQRGDLSQEYEMDCDGFMLEELFDPNDWMDSCRDNYDVIVRKIMQMLAALDNRISKSVVSEVSGLMGAWADEVDDVTGNVLQVTTLTSGGNPNPNAWNDIDVALQLTNYCNDTFIVGGQTLYKYNRLMEAGCCAASGLNLGDIFNLYGRASALDIHIQQTVGSNISWVIQRGAIQLLTMNLNGGRETDIGYINVGPNAGSEFAGIINSPFTGIPYDLTVRYVCRQIHIILEARVKAVGMPLDMFPASHRMDGVTYTGVIEVVAPS